MDTTRKYFAMKDSKQPIRKRCAYAEAWVQHLVEKVTDPAAFAEIKAVDLRAKPLKAPREQGQDVPATQITRSRPAASLALDGGEAGAATAGVVDRHADQQHQDPEQRSGPGVHHAGIQHVDRRQAP